MSLISADLNLTIKVYSSRYKRTQVHAAAAIVHAQSITLCVFVRKNTQSVFLKFVYVKIAAVYS